MNSSTPLACNMNVFTSAQREAHIVNTTQLIRNVQNVREIEHGYEFLYPNETQFISSIAEFVSKERLCCPFLEFTVQVFSNGQPISFSLTGPTGTQEFLRAEFDGAFS